MRTDNQPSCWPDWNQTSLRSERREATRFEPAEERLWLGWWGTPRDFHVIGAILVNISRTGAAVTVTDPPEVGQPVWLRLEGTEHAANVQGEVVGVEPFPDQDSYRVRMRFTSNCPEAFFRLAVEGAVPD